MRAWEIVDGLVGTPCDEHPDPPRSFDCVTLVRFARVLLGLEKNSAISRGAPIFGRGQKFECADTPQDGDVLAADGHFGVYLANGMLHAYLTRRGGSVVFWTWAQACRQFPELEPWR